MTRTTPARHSKVTTGDDSPDGLSFTTYMRVVTDLVFAIERGESITATSKKLAATDGFRARVEQYERALTHLAETRDRQAMFDVRRREGTPAWAVRRL